jgi:hypothetical protein
METNNIAKCTQTVEQLFEKYKDNEYMLQRLVNHVTAYLPNTLESELVNYEKRVNRQTFLSYEQQTFIQVFLSKYQYFYLPNNNCFYEYNGKKYIIVKEDDIIHKLLSSISKDRVLLQWKYKTKINIIKQIKDRHLFQSIPDTDTIQSILGMLTPLVFTTKNQAKYFLTIIGDNILKKNLNHIFLVTNKMKRVLDELNNIACASIGNTSTTHNFMTKYHENHLYENCRLIKMNDKLSGDVWKDIIRTNGLDLLCVAAHYSNRYTDSDKFIDNNSDEELKGYAYYLKNTTQEEIVSKFCSKYIIESDETTPPGLTSDLKIEWKNLHFIWKHFLSEMFLPNMMFSNTLKSSLKEKYAFDETTDSFINVTSRYLPIHSDFIKFWTATMNVNNECVTIATNMQPHATVHDMFDNELELDEICSLFKFWTKTCGEQLMTTGNISEENVLRILKHFFPDIEIIEDKYVLNVSCLLWDKSKDIFNSFEFIKEQVKAKNNLALISFDDAYNYYYKHCSANSRKFIVSKRYFEKYLYFNLSQHIVYEKFIETDWILKN